MKPIHAFDLVPTHPATASALDTRKVAVVAAFGVVLWFVGIFQIRWADAAGVLSNGFTPLVYALIVVGTVPFVRAAPHLIGLPRAYRMHCGAIMGAVASLLDAIAVRWTDWYASEPKLLAESAATLLWAIGVTVALGVVMSRGGSNSG